MLGNSVNDDWYTEKKILGNLLVRYKIHGKDTKGIKFAEINFVSHE